MGEKNLSSIQSYNSKTGKKKRKNKRRTFNNLLLCDWIDYFSLTNLSKNEPTLTQLAKTLRIEKNELPNPPPPPSQKKR